LSFPSKKEVAISCGKRPEPWKRVISLLQWLFSRSRITHWFTVM
jgi:hypothetical protein